MFETISNCWPVAAGIGVVLISLFFQTYRGRIPNALSLGAIVVAWMLSMNNANFREMHSIHGSLTTSLSAALLALGITLPMYVHGLGAGCVKTQMAFGAWVGCGLPLIPALIVTAVATLLAVMLTLIGCYIMTARRCPETEETQQFFPAQMTFSLGTMLGVSICWIAASLM